MGTWLVEIRGTITRDIRLVDVTARSAGSAMARAVKLHPTYRAASAMEVGAHRVALSRLVAVANGLGLLTEGQLSNITNMGRVDIRAAIDEGLIHLRNDNLSGKNGAHIMTQLGLG